MNTITMDIAAVRLAKLENQMRIKLNKQRIYSDDADDLISDVKLKVLTSVSHSKYDDKFGEKGFAAFVSMILYRSAIAFNTAKRAKSNQQTELKESSQISYDFEDRLIESIMCADEAVTLHDLINRANLSSDDLEIVKLKLEGSTTKEIAERYQKTQRCILQRLDSVESKIRLLFK